MASSPGPDVCVQLLEGLQDALMGAMVKGQCCCSQVPIRAQLQVLHLGQFWRKEPSQVWPQLRRRFQLQSDGLQGCLGGSGRPAGSPCGGGGCMAGPALLQGCLILQLGSLQGTLWHPCGGSAAW